MIPKNITKEHIESAIKKIQNTGIKENRKSSKFNVIYEGVAYPPKLVISTANEYANGTALDSSDFSGGEETNSFLEKRGFVVSRKDDPVKLLIKSYKKRISQNHLEEEVYKWKFVKKYNKRPNTDANNFSQEVKDIKFKNLIYQMGIHVVDEMLGLLSDKTYATIESKASIYMIYLEKWRLSIIMKKIENFQN